MKVLEKWKRFLTLKHKEVEGFTLVELIVVIAILGILAGVGTLGYSGYIKKAERAADEQLLSAINTAFASACMANGESNYNRTDVEATHAEIKDDGAFVYTGPFSDTFSEFYEDGEFKVIEDVIYDALFGGFKDPAVADTLTLTYGGAQITLTAEQIQALKDSSFYGEGMTSEKLLNQVDNVAVIAGGMGPINNIMGTTEFIAFATAALGLEAGADLSKETHRLALKKLGWTEADYTATQNNPSEFADYQAAVDQVLGNALVLYTAQQTTQLGDGATALLNGITHTQIANNMGADKTPQEKQTGMNQAALAYGMYYAYVNSDACTDSNIKGKSDIAPTDVTTALDSNTEFQQYMNSTQGKNDMKAYLEALSIINQGATGNPGAVEQLLTNGFVDLNDLLTSTMGK